MDIKLSGGFFMKPYFIKYNPNLDVRNFILHRSGFE